MIQTICVCGAGTMGSGIAQVAIQSGFQTILYDLSNNALEQAQRQIAANLQLQVHKKRLSQTEAADAAARLHISSDISRCIAGVVVEAVAENAEIKAELFNRIAAINPPGTILATNTSSLSVTEIAAGVIAAERVAGMHFFNPAPVMKLVEVVRAAQTSEATVTTLAALAEKMGKTPVICNDAPGFIVNHVARPYYLEALALAEAGAVDMAVIDALMEASGFKMGPFKLMDLIGNDINYAVSCSVYEAMGVPPRLKPSPLQRQKVERGELGRKSGRGYYEYPPSQKNDR